MSMMEEFLQLQEKVAKLEKVIKKKEDEIDKKDDKILDLSEKVNELTNETAKSISDTRHFRGLVSILETDKKNLERERDRLMNEMDAMKIQLKQFALMIETTNQTLQAKEESLLSKEKQLQQKDFLIIEKDNNIEDLRKEKEKYQVDKFEFMEQLSNEKLKFVEKIGVLEKNLQANEQKYKSIKKKTRDAQDGLLGASMEIEKVREEKEKSVIELKKIKENYEKLQKEKKVLGEKYKNVQKSGKKGKKGGSSQILPADLKENKKYQEIIANLEMRLEQYEKGEVVKGTSEDIAKVLFSKKTGTFNNITAFLVFLKNKLTNVRRTIRIILPEMGDIEKYGLKEKFLALPKNILKNIACTVDTENDDELLNDLRKRNFRITDYRGVKLFALTVDNITAALAVFDKKKNSITGIFSNDEELVRLLSQSIISPFIKGIKLN